MFAKSKKIKGLSHTISCCAGEWGSANLKGCVVKLDYIDEIM